MRFIKHLLTVLRVGLWRNLAKVNIGDPLNKLVFVAKYRPYTEEK